MSKLFSLILFFIITGTSVSARAAEQDIFVAELHNICGYTIHVRAWDFTNTPPILTDLGAGEKLAIITLHGLTNDTKELENENISYGLALLSRRNVIFFDWEKFLVLLRKSEKSQRGGVITLAIKDPSICPGN